MRPARRLGPGTLVLVVGPSGAGKDTLIRLAAGLLDGDPRIRFARRIVTRPADADSEDHDSLAPADFERLVRQSGTALDWPAHGLSYALPASIDAWIADGLTVVANVSRRIIGAAARKYAQVAVVHITAPEEALRARLAARGRERGGDIEERLGAVPLDIPPGVGLHEIVNDGAPEAAAWRLCSVLESLARQAARGTS